VGATRTTLEQLYAAAVAAVEPAALVSRCLRRDGARLSVPNASISWDGPTVLVGAGKAAARMADAAAAILGPELIVGAVIAPEGALTRASRLRCLPGGHPLPTVAGERSTRELTALLQQHAQAAVLALVSGGASSLLVQPAPPVTLADKIAVNAALLACGADIHEFNTLRKHLSLVKGGGLLRIARGRPLISLIVSDVIGDDPATIGSGPTTPDPSTFADALQVVQRYHLSARLPPAVLERLHAGAHGQIAETVKPGERGTEQVTNAVIGSNRIALVAAAAAARAAGFEPIIAAEPLAGDTSVAARRFAEWVVRACAAHSRPLCLLAGGETTVQLDAGSGRGGRNQEFALACAERFAGHDVSLLSAGTDGIDGPTDAAGAFADGTTWSRAQALGLDPLATLTRHDSYTLFAALGDLLRPGPTGTNVMDVKIALTRSA
jgi:hydroxypyruvate reductase